jgi:hypothetical protein
MADKDRVKQALDLIKLKPHSYSILDLDETIFC